jgi:serine/threonine-protein kinase
MMELPCPPELWSDFSRLLDEALALPAAERERWLAELPTAQNALLPFLHTVLKPRPSTQNDAALQTPHLSPNTSTIRRLAGDAVGPYVLIRPLGSGGMGEVWLVRRADGAYEREVALKLPHAHLLAGALRERFARERDILAALSHTNIARFYDAGLAADGQPYLVLEAIEGVPITDWCQSSKLPLEQRLGLFRQVLMAVMHAHSRLVAHRDLKPANVLVTPVGEVKLLDFGIAKLLHDESRVNVDTLTSIQSAPATPRYAAPEQLSGAPVSAATDVYSLGLMLFELLVDKPAVAGHAFEGLRGGVERDMPLPSQSCIDPTRRRALIGDLDAIVHRATQHEPVARYESVAALADDIDGYVNHRPIAARHITRWDRVAKFVGRHRLTVALSTALTLALVAGIAGIAWQAHEARAQARRAEAVKDFLLGVFSAADPRLPADKPNGQTPAKALLDRAVARIDERFADDPDLRIELMRTAADVYRELDELVAYQSLQERQLALVVQRYGPLHANVLDALHEAATLAHERGDLEQCRTLLRKLDDSLRRANQDASELRASWWTTWSICHRDQPAQAKLRSEALENAQALFARTAPGQRGHVTALIEISSEHISQNRLGLGIAAGEAAARMSEALPGRNEAELQTIYSNLGVARMQSGDLTGAGADFGRAAAVAARTVGSDSRKTWAPRSRQARALHLGGDRAAAWPLFDSLLAAFPPPSEPSPDANYAREDAGERFAAEGRPALAVPLLQQAEQGYMHSSNFEFALRRVRRHLGDALDRAGQHSEARRVLASALKDYETNNPHSSQPVVAVRERWARFLLEQGELAPAQVAFEQVIKDAADPYWAHVALARAGLARVMLARKDTEKALHYSALALGDWDQLKGFRDVRMQAYLWRVRAATLDKAGAHTEAKTLRDRALAQAKRTDAPESPTLTQTAYLGL